MLAMLLAKVGFLALLAAALCDLGWRLVPNPLPLVLALSGLLLRLEDGTPAIVQAALAASGMTLGLGVAWWSGLIGGGDAKLAAAASLFVPPAAVGSFLLATALAGGLLALAFLAARPLLPAHVRPAGRGAPLLRRFARAEVWRIRRGILPYAVAIAVGAVVARIDGAVA